MAQPCHLVATWALVADGVASPKLPHHFAFQAHSGASLRDRLQCVSHKVGSPSRLHRRCTRMRGSSGDDETSVTCFHANGRASRAQSQACLSYAETKPALALANTLRDPSEMDVAVCGGKKGGRKEGRKIFRPHSHPKPKENHKKRDALLGSTSFHVLSLITMSSEIIRRVSRLSSLFYCYCHRRRRHHHRRSSGLSSQRMHSAPTGNRAGRKLRSM